MNKTLRQSHNGKLQQTDARHFNDASQSQFNGLHKELFALRQAAAELLSPRPEAIKRLLQLSREFDQA